MKNRNMYGNLDTTGVDYDPSEWQLCGSPLYSIVHMPTFSIFQIECDERARANGSLSMRDFSARVVHIAEGECRPSDEKVKFLARSAVAAYLEKAGPFLPSVPGSFGTRNGCVHGKPMPK
jgi:hypothetical protein